MENRAELLIRGGMVIDGTGCKAYAADVAIAHGRIMAIGDLHDVHADRVLDADGMVVTPGLIDSHAHSDTMFLQDSSYASKLYQGITTEVSGQCGGSPFPAERDGTDPWQCASFDAFVKQFEQSGHRMGVNQAMLVGHGSLRASVMGYEDRAPTEAELTQMKAKLADDLAAGAWGMSLGLEYAPGFFADAHELQELGRVVKQYDGLIPCHMRNEGLHIDEAIDELVSVGHASGVHVHVSHLKLDHFRVHGRADEVWARIEQARASGVNITADLYPFTASCTTLTIRCPKWSQEGGSAALVSRLQGPRKQEIIEGIRQHYFNAARAETCVLIDDSGYWPEIIGHNLRDIAETYLHTEDYAAAAAEVLIRTQGKASCIFFVMDEADMLYFLRQDVGIGSDGWAMPVDAALVRSKPHPRSYAAIPEFFRLAKAHRLCSLEEAVRRVTSVPADMIGMRDRGRLKPGMIADVTVFDPMTYGPKATYLDPVQAAQGVRYVLIGGCMALENGVQTDGRYGAFLRKPQPEKHA